MWSAKAFCFSRLSMLDGYHARKGSTDNGIRQVSLGPRHIRNSLLHECALGGDRLSPRALADKREFLLSLASGDISPVFLMLGLVINVFVYGLFAMVGGILLVALLRRQGGAPPPAA